MQSIFWSLGAFMFTLSILITLHEFGHLYIARSCGIHVERFSIGFGKSLFRYIDRHGTEFVITVIPLGGYVKMLDENIETITRETPQDNFNNKTFIFIRRIIIVAAGPIANFIFAIFTYWLVFMIGIPGIRPIVGEITANSIAANAQITPGMELKTIDDIETPDWDTVRLQLVNKIGNTKITISVLPLGSSQQQRKVLNLQHWSFDPYKEDPIVSLGINPCNIKIETVLAEVLDCCAAQKAGLQVGDKIVKVNGQPLIRWMTFTNLVRNNLGKPLALEVERQGYQLSLTLIPDIKPGGSKVEGFAGVLPKITLLPDKYKILHQYEPFRAFIKAISKTWQLMKLIINILKKIITSNVKLNNLSGPISIAQGARISAGFGVVHYLIFLANISINLGIINLFPLPILDGGHLLFLMIEKLKGRPISKQIQNISYHISSILLVLLMGFTLFNDFSRL